jgi:outer membrane lipoprotein-sorting protein
MPNSKNPLRQQLRELAELRPEAEQSRQAIAAARAAVVAASSQQPRTTLWSLVMQRPRSFAAAATLLVAAALALAFFSGGHAPQAAFAQVVAEVDKTKTVQYLETRSTIPRAGEPRGPSTVTKVMILGRHRERKEVLAETPGEPLEPGHSWTRIALVVSISDLERGKLVTLDPERKLFSEAKTLLSISPDDMKITETEVAPAPEVDFYARMRDIPAKPTEELPEREINGQRITGYRLVEKHERPEGVDTWTRTYWVDATTKLPVQVEVTAESTHPRMGQSRWLLTDIVFDEPLDASLFSTDPPEGYTVQGE